MNEPVVTYIGDVARVVVKLSENALVAVVALATAPESGPADSRTAAADERLKISERAVKAVGVVRHDHIALAASDPLHHGAVLPAKLACVRR